MLKKTIIIFLSIICFYTAIFAQTSNLTIQSLVDSIKQIKDESVSSENIEKLNPNPLSEIEIVGNIVIPQNVIKNEIFLVKGEELNPYKIARVVKNIKGLGVFADVETEILKTINGNKLKIRVTENPKISRIIIKGNNVIETAVLTKELKLKEQELLNLNVIREDIAKIEEIYAAKGYKWAHVLSVDTPKKEGEPVILNISEGTLSEIEISGNVKTQENIILREMDLLPGSVLEEKVLKEDLRRIFNLNYFGELIPDIELLPENKYKLILSVTEKSSGSISFGGGFGQTTGGFGFIDFYLDNLLGSGQLIALRGQFGINTTYEFKYFNPWMWDKRKSFMFKLWNKFGDFDYLLGNNVSYRNEKRLGTEVTIGWPLDYNLRSSHSFTMESITPQSQPAYHIVSYMLNFSYDTRDVWFNPLEGEYHSLSIEKGFKVYQNAIDFIKYDLSLRKFIKTFENQIIAARADFGYMTGDLIDKEPYYIGGSNTVRGYDDKSPFAKGPLKTLFNLEYRFLFNEVISALLFVDTGYTSSSFTDLMSLSKFRIGKGIGIRLNTPIGPFRLDYGIGDYGGGFLHFNIGHVF